MTTKTKKVQRRLVQSAKTNSHRVHITPRTNGWAIRKEENFQASKVLSTQKEAIAFAKTWINSGLVSSVILHGKNGSFRAVR